MTDEKKVEVPQSLLEQMQGEIKELQKKLKKQEVLLGDEVVEEEKEKKQEVRLREYDGKLVVGLNTDRGTWLQYDKEKREENLMQEIILMDDKGNESRKAVAYSEFTENSKEIKVPVKSIRKEEVVDKKGLIRVKEVIDYTTVMKKDKVMQKVVSSNDYLTVILPNGQEKEINVNFINL